MASEAMHQRYEAEIASVERAYDGAWCQGDVDALVRLFTDRAVLVNPRRDVARGHAEIRRVLGDVLTGPAKGSRHLSELVRVQLITDEVAIVDGEATLENVVIDGHVSSMKHRFTDVLVRDGDTWRIDHVRAYE